MSYRIEKINDLIRDCIAEVFLKHLSFKKGVFISISKVDTSKDLHYTQVFISVFPLDEQNYVFTTISKELYHIQGLLNKKLHIKNLPKLTFIPDSTQQNVSVIEEVFYQIQNEKNKKDDRS